MEAAAKPEVYRMLVESSDLLFNFLSYLEDEAMGEEDDLREEISKIIPNCEQGALHTLKLPVISERAKAFISARLAEWINCYHPGVKVISPSATPAEQKTEELAPPRP